MKNYILFLISIICFVSYSQETENYKRFSNQIVPIETKTIEEKFKNGQIKEIKTLTTYEFNDEQFIFFTGSYILYSKKGVKLLERTHNMFGSPLTLKAYDNNGNLFEYSEAIELDTNASSIENFLVNDKTVSIITETEEYIVKKNKVILYQKGIKVNSRKSGNWNIYENGVIRKTKEHKERLKFENVLADKYK